MGRYGKKNHVSTDQLSYVHCLIGDSGVGKTTVVKEYLDLCSDGKEETYLFLELGNERGADAIEGINSINVPIWYSGDLDEEELEIMELNGSAPLDLIINDIVENKDTYPNLKMIVLDTFDQFIDLAEHESIRLWNKKCRKEGKLDKVSETINATWDGFGRGEKYAMKLMDSVVDELKSVGVSVFFIGHAKRKEITDSNTEQSYQALSSDQQQNYFNHLKKSVHVLGLAYIDREFLTEKNTKDNKRVNKKVSKEARKIVFRTDKFILDAKSRLKYITDQIPLDAKAYYDAIEEAIKMEQSSNGVSYDDAKKREKEKKESLDKLQKNKQDKKENLEELKVKIFEYMKDNKDDMSKIQPIATMCKELCGSIDPKKITNIDDALKIVALIK